PLYAFLRRQGQSPADAEDTTQAFFTKLLSSDILASANPERGKL
ncbi:MAG: DNA-directed RNA polymerase specialized sigma24 family protein, partial [Pseudoalteromonas tetraodonis]